MKTLSVLVTMACFLGLLMLGGQAMGGPSALHLNWGTEVNPGQCPDGELVINVTHKVTNDGDSGLAGYWAYDNYNRHIQLWQLGEGTFCAVVRYLGSFTTIAGRSPGDTDEIAAGIKGTFEGGYRATITGTLKSDPLYRTRGNIGAFDYGWDGHSNHGAHTPFSWLATYFDSYTFAYDWWGWVYHGGGNGTWVNAVTGNQGDITD